jgi:hypothetical protein
MYWLLGYILSMGAISMKKLEVLKPFYLFYVPYWLGIHIDTHNPYNSTVTKIFEYF